MYRALQKNACDYVMPDLMRIGGVTGWMRAAAIADAAGIQMSTHLYPEVSCASDARHAHCPLAGVAGLVPPDPWRSRSRSKDGTDPSHLIKPGNGLDWNEKAVKRYADEGMREAILWPA